MMESAYESISYKNLWNVSPTPELFVEDQQVIYANEACLALLEISEEQLRNQPNWPDLCLPPESTNRKKFYDFLTNHKMQQVSMQLQTARELQIDVILLKKRLDDRRLLISLQDVTELKQETQILQATYDEFMTVTVNLEQALSTIEEQKQLLEEQKEILDNELRLAHLVQDRLFAQDFKNFQLLDIFGSYQVMSDLGGDMWEFHENRDELLIVLGDVMGHGVDSSLISIVSKHLFKTKFEEEPRLCLTDICKFINKELTEITRGRHYITICMIRVDRHYKMEYMTCGHPPMIHMPADQQKEPSYLLTEQPMLGVFDNVPYVSASMQLQSKDRILLYTDCLSESLNDKGEFLDVTEIAPLVQSELAATPKDAIERILSYREEHTGSETLPDDLALICVEVPD